MIGWLLEFLLRKAGVNIIRKEEILDVARRYFFINAFDGLMISLGVLLGGYFGGGNAKGLLFALIGSVIAMGLSGFFGAYVSERAERLKVIKETENQIYTDLSGTKYESQLLKASALIAFIDASAPVVSSLPAIVVLLFNYFGLLAWEVSVFSAFGLSLLILMMLGYELGKMSGEKPLIYSVALLFLGLLLAFITLMLGGV